MGKFAGILKRLKQFANTTLKGIKWVKDKWNTYITKPGVGLLNSILPGSNYLTDALFAVDNKINQGINWAIDKTSDRNVNEQNNKPINPSFYRNDPDIVPGHRPVPITPNIPSQPIRTPLDRSYFNFNK